MTLSVRDTPYIIPEYSLTGDLLSFLVCPLQYRYHNKGSLPPSKPVQLWFGEFIHGVMEEAYKEWNLNNRRQFPWNWIPEIRDIELQIDKRLKAKGLNTRAKNFCPFSADEVSARMCPDNNHPHKRIASKRADAAINVWGQHLFPLIDEAEVKLKDIRDMPNFDEEKSRSYYYGITGIVDVISSINLLKNQPGNLILNHLNNNNEIQEILGCLETPEYEIIIDYKGMRRPSKYILDDSNDLVINPVWEHHEWQILTYAWLRYKQSKSKIVAGILFYLDELVPSNNDMNDLKKDVRNTLTDIMPPNKFDEENILEWKSGDEPLLTSTYKENRSIRIIPITNDKIMESLVKFDDVVNDIENAVLTEVQGNNITSAWHSNPVERTCTACDFKTVCPNPAPRHYNPTVP